MVVGRVLLGTGAGHIRVADKTAKRIRRIAREMGYQPNRMAQQLAGRASEVIGVIIDSRSPGIYFNRLSAIEKLAAEAGYRLMVGQSHGDLNQLRGYCNDFASRGVDGVVCITHRYPGYGDKVAELFTRLKNVVFIGEPASNRLDLNVIAIDTPAAVCQIVEHLAGLGRQRIGLLLYSSGSHSMEMRLTGYTEGLRRVGLAVNERLVTNVEPSDGFTPQAIEPAVERLIDGANADAIIAVNDIVAIHVIKSLKRRGLRVPEDIAIAGYDNTDVSRLYEPSLTTVDQQTEIVSQFAMRLLMSLIRGEELSPQDRRLVVAPLLKVRESTAGVRLDHDSS